MQRIGHQGENALWRLILQITEQNRFYSSYYFSCIPRQPNWAIYSMMHSLLLQTKICFRITIVSNMWHHVLSDTHAHATFWMLLSPAVHMYSIRAIFTKLTMYPTNTRAVFTWRTHQLDLHAMLKEHLCTEVQLSRKCHEWRNFLIQEKFHISAEL